MSRLSWDQYFMRMAEMAATRATCCRKSVGAVLVRDNTILSTGYNGRTWVRYGNTSLTKWKTH